MDDIIKIEQDFTNFKWSEMSSSASSGGSLLKASVVLDSEKYFYKMSSYDEEHFIYGYECINELIVSRLLDIWGIDHVRYKLIKAKVKISENGKMFTTYVNESKDYKKPDERKMTFGEYYRIYKKNDDTPYDFICRLEKEGRSDIRDFFDGMFFVDYIILNRDRHAKNIEVLIDKNENIKMAPLFDQGLSLLLESYDNEPYVRDYNVLLDRSVNNFVGTRSTLENLQYIKNKKRFENICLTKEDYKKISEGLDEFLPVFTIEKIKMMIEKRLEWWKNSL